MDVKRTKKCLEHIVWGLQLKLTVLRCTIARKQALSVDYFELFRVITYFTGNMHTGTMLNMTVLGGKNSTKQLSFHNAKTVCMVQESQRNQTDAACSKRQVSTIHDLKFLIATQACLTESESVRWFNTELNMPLLGRKSAMKAVFFSQCNGGYRGTESHSHKPDGVRAEQRPSASNSMKGKSSQ